MLTFLLMRRQQQNDSADTYTKDNWFDFLCFFPFFFLPELGGFLKAELGKLIWCSDFLEMWPLSDPA